MVAVDGTGQAETEKVNTNIITLTRFLTEEQVKHKEATGDFTYVQSTLVCSA
jgi:fructose-1,6-bisphosphatase I